MEDDEESMLRNDGSPPVLEGARLCHVTRTEYVMLPFKDSAIRSVENHKSDAFMQVQVVRANQPSRPEIRARRRREGATDPTCPPAASASEEKVQRTKRFLFPPAPATCPPAALEEEVQRTQRFLFPPAPAHLQL